MKMNLCNALLQKCIDYYKDVFEHGMQQVKCSCFDQPKRLVKTDIGRRQSVGALFERFHAIITSVFAALADTA